MLRILIPLLLVVSSIALAGCTTMAPAPPVAPVPELPSPDYENSTWHMYVGASVGLAGYVNAAGGEQYAQIPPGTHWIRATANWTCPSALACKISVMGVRENNDNDEWQDVNGTSPLSLEWRNPLPGRWYFSIGDADDGGVAYEARGNLSISFCCT